MRLLALIAILATGCATSGTRAAHDFAHSQRRIWDVLIEKRDGLSETVRQRDSAEVRANSLRECLPLPKKGMRVYGIGSSTMGALLGPMLKNMVAKRHKATMKFWGKASSGLARPDFHDWPKLVAGLMGKHRPHVVVVSLGTNDFQALKTDQGKWLRPVSPRWALRYGQRIDKMLKRLTGPKRRRPVIWIGPTSFPGENAARMGPKITALLRSRIEAFAGPVFLVDAWENTTDDEGRPGKVFQVEGMKKPLPMRGHDTIHLTAKAVRALMARPAADVIGTCLAK